MNTTPITEIKMPCCGEPVTAIGERRQVFRQRVFETETLALAFDDGDFLNYYCLECDEEIVDATDKFLDSLPLELLPD